MRLRKIVLVLFLALLYIIISNGLRFYQFYEESEVSNLIDDLPEAMETFHVMGEDESKLLTGEPKPPVEPSGEPVKDDVAVTAPTAPIEQEPSTEHGNKYDVFYQETMEEIQDLAEAFTEEMSDQPNVLSQGMTLMKYEKQARDLEERADQQFEDFLKDIEAGVDDSEWTHVKESYEIKYQQSKKQIMKKANELLAREESQ